MKIIWSDVVKKRSSVRLYNGSTLATETVKRLEDFAATIKGPFDPRVRFEFIYTTSGNMEQRQKIGTYGFIHGSQHFIASIVEKGEKDLEQLGYVFEQLILFATSLGLGTCWLGGTFNRKHLGKAIKLNENEILPAISPVGYKASKDSFLSKAMKWSVKSKHRKPWDELFFYSDTLAPLSEKEADQYHLALNLVRLAPSATNRQPWRIVKDPEGWHFYLCESKLVSKTTPFNMQRIDMGIAMCHFELGTKEKMLNGQWKVLDRFASSYKTNKWKYCSSWIPS